LIDQTEEPADNLKLSDSLPSDRFTHLAYLDGLRAIAAIYVVAHHAKWQVYGDGLNRHGIDAVICQIFKFGHDSVTMFIMLSGFCLMLPVIKSKGMLKGGAALFIRKRVKRIVPPYYFALIFSGLLIAIFIGHKTGTWWDQSVPVTLGGVLAHLFLVQDLFPRYTPDIDYPLWSISVEWRIYFLFPLLVFMWQKLGPVLSTCLSFGISIVFAEAVGHFFNYYPSLQYVGVFSLGMLAAAIAYWDHPELKKLSELPWKLISVPCFVTWLAYAWRLPKSNYLEDLIFSLFGFCLLLTLAKPLQRRSVAFYVGAKPIAFLGTFSYSIYLIHAPLLQLLEQYMFSALHYQPALMFIAFVAIGIPLIVGVSYMFHVACERPFMNVKPKHELIIVTE
jgi:peptidoglycan/LPS O-acetylase OafA/YrhL